MELEYSVSPPETVRTGCKPKYPFGLMQVGDSILVEDKKDFAKVRTASHAFGLRKGMRFASRTTKEGMLRIWRTE